MRDDGHETQKTTAGPDPRSPGEGAIRGAVHLGAWRCSGSSRPRLASGMGPTADRPRRSDRQTRHGASHACDKREPYTKQEISDHKVAVTWASRSYPATACRAGSRSSSVPSAAAKTAGSMGPATSTCTTSATTKSATSTSTAADADAP